MPSTYKRDKPWDTDGMPSYLEISQTRSANEAVDIDKWKVDKFTEEDNKGGTFVEESSFATLCVIISSFAGNWLTPTPVFRNIANSISEPHGLLSRKASLSMESHVR
jgi:hypothetical protein